MNRPNQSIEGGGRDAVALPPHENFFLNNKTGSGKTSSNVFPVQALLKHDKMNDWIDSLYPPGRTQFSVPASSSHRQQAKDLNQIIKTMTGQWIAEVEAGFNICAHGFGSKLYIARQFARSIRLATSSRTHPIIMVDGYSSEFSLRDVFLEICKLLVPSDLKLPSTIVGLKEVIAKGLSPASEWKDDRAPPQMIVLIINSIDAIPMRTLRIQSALAELSSIPQITIFATADTPNFQLMWDSDMRERLHMLFHDCTTFSSFHAETDFVQTIEYMLGGKGARTGGIAGVDFVLKSLPRNARSLFSLLIQGQLEAGRADARKDADPEEGDYDDDNDDDADADGEEKGTKGIEKNAGVEYHVLFTKMSEELICTSIHQFHTLLKEFIDHQLIELIRDSSGATRLRAPFRPSELAMLLAQLGAEEE